MMKTLFNLTKWFRSNPADAPVKSSAVIETPAAADEFPPGDMAADEASAIAYASQPDTGKLPFLVQLAVEGRASALAMLSRLQIDVSQALVPLAEADNAAGIKAVVAAIRQSRSTAPGAAGAFMTAVAKNSVNAMAALPRRMFGLSDYGFQMAAETAGENGATGAMAFIAEEVVRRWQENPQRDTEPQYFYALRAGFNAAAAKGHSETAAVALRTMNAYPFAKTSPPRTYTGRHSLIDA